MENSDQIIKDIQEAFPVLKEEYKVKTLGIFGSYIRGEQTDKSDIDILVDFDAPVSIFRFVDLSDRLSAILHKKVDLVMRSALKPNIGKSILGEVKYI